MYKKSLLYIFLGQAVLVILVIIVKGVCQRLLNSLLSLVSIFQSKKKKYYGQSEEIFATLSRNNFSRLEIKLGKDSMRTY